MNKIVATSFIILGSLILMTGLLFGLKIFKPSEFVLLAGMAALVVGLFSVMAKYVQDKNSSQKSDTILSTVGNLTNQNTELHSQNDLLQSKVDSLHKSLDTQIETVDTLRKENTELYEKLRISQQDIMKNTERGLQPLSLNPILINVSMDFDNPKIHDLMDKIMVKKKQLESLFSPLPPAIDGQQRQIPGLPGIVASPDRNNKISTYMTVYDQSIINEVNFDLPNVEVQISKLDPITEEANFNKKLVLGSQPEIPFCLALTSQKDIDQQKLLSASLDFAKKTISFAISIRCRESFDNGELSSFKDVFGKYLKVESFFNSGQDNLQYKMKIVSLIVLNNAKRLQFVFNDSELSNAKGMNATAIHVITHSDLLK